MKELIEIQSALKAPKGQFNKFGNYNYRSCEDILEAVKPHLTEHKCSLIICDKIINIGNRFYVEATATLTAEDGKQVSTTAYARETESKKGMDDAQLTGATSSYARKYALNGLFCIDDTKDADATNKHNKDDKLSLPAVDIAKLKKDGVDYIKSFKSAQAAIEKISMKKLVDDEAAAIITEIFEGEDGQ